MEGQILPPSLKDRIRRLLGNRIEPIWIRSSDLDPVAGGSDWIEEIIFDMAVHARSGMPMGGRVVIEAANIELDEVSAESEGLVAGRYVMLEMTCIRRDPSENAVDLTVPTVDLANGLWMDTLLPEARNIIHSMGGAISEYNEPGKAVTLRAFFPSAVRILFSDEKDFQVTSEDNPETILLVEDESYVRDVASEILQLAGYRVLTAKCGSEALEIVNEHGPVQLLVTDVVMPGMNGHELSQRLKTLNPELKTIYISGYNDNPVLRLGVQENQIAYLKKPFTLDSLTGIVREVLTAGA